MVVFDPGESGHYELREKRAGGDGKGGEIVSVENNPEDVSTGHREVTFSNEIYIEREDFMEVPPKKFFRLAPPGKWYNEKCIYYQV